MPEAAPSRQILRFGVFELDLRAGELRKQGLKVRLQERPLQILALLLEKPGEVVTREELRQKLWPADTFVDFDHSVNTAINKLRDALGDSAENPRFVETLPRHGYRFIGHVEPVKGVRAPTEPGTSPAQDRPAGDSATAVAGHAPSPIRERHRSRRITALVAGGLVAILPVLIALNVAGLRGRFFGPVAVPKIESIAVLPMENLSGDPGQEYFADGMTEELITDLGKISALRVISRQSVMHYKKSKKTLPEIARELKVDAIVEGAVRRSGDRVRITAQLVRTHPERQVWTESYDRHLREVLTLQSEIASAVAGKVHATLTPAERSRLATAHTVNPEAYEAYLKGMEQWYKLTPQNIDTALEYFKLALKRDPNYAAAYAGVAAVWIGRQQMGYTAPREAGPKAKAAALKAVELDNTLAQAHQSLAGVMGSYEWDWAGAEREYKRAIELNPNYPGVRAGYSHYLMIMKRPEEAMAQIQRALELDPLNAFYQLFYAVDLELAGRYEEAIAELRKALRTSPRLPPAHWVLSDALFMKGLYEESFAEVKAYYAGDREMQEALGQGYAQSGYRGAMKRAADLQASRSLKTYVLPCDVAMLYGWAGEKAQALEWLEKGFEARDTNMPYINVDPMFAPLRSDPRFQALMRRMNLRP